MADKDCEKSEKLIHQLKPSFTVQNAIDSSGFHKFQIVLVLISGFSWLASAMEIMLLAVMTPSLKCEWQLSTVEQALCTTFVFLGWTLSSPVWGRVCDVRGRRQGLIIASFVCFTFGILTALAPNFYLFLAARFGVGLAVGGLTQTVTLTAEFLPSNHRAKWLIVLKSFWAIGTAIVAALSIFVLPTMGWRWLVVFSTIPLALFGICCWWLPESVRFDVARGKVVEARATLERIAQFNGRALPEGELIGETEEPSRGVLDLLKVEHRRTSIVLWLIWILTNAMYYGLAIYTSLLLSAPEDRCSAATVDPIEEMLRVKRSEDLQCSLTTENYINIMVTTMSEVPGYIITAFAIDFIGRRATFAVGYALVAACSVVMCFCLPRFAIIAALFIGKSAIGSVGQAGYIYASEVYPTPLRAQGLGMASAFGRAGAMITPIITQVLATQNIVYPAIVYSIGGAVSIVLALLLPETKGKSMQKSKAGKEQQ